MPADDYEYGSNTIGVVTTSDSAGDWGGGADSFGKPRAGHIVARPLASRCASFILAFFFGLSSLLFAAQLHAQPKLYVVNLGSNSVSVVDAQAGSVIKTIPAPGGITSIAYNPTTKRLYLPTTASAGQVYLIDPTADAIAGGPIAGVGPGAIHTSVSPELAPILFRYAAAVSVDVVGGAARRDGGH